jgi:hypothetical protein
LPFEVVRITRKLLGDEKSAIPDLPFKPLDPFVSNAGTAGPDQSTRLFKKMAIIKRLDRQAKYNFPASRPLLSYT